MSRSKKSPSLAVNHNYLTASAQSPCGA